MFIGFSNTYKYSAADLDTVKIKAMHYFCVDLTFLGEEDDDQRDG